MKRLTIFLAIISSLTNIGMSGLPFCASNNENWKRFLISQFETSEESIDVVIHNFTDKELADCLIEAHLRGVRVRVYIDKAQMTERVKTRKYLGENGINIRFSAEPHAIQENFCIINKKKVISDFPNWISVLSQTNEEKLLISADSKIVSAYRSKFERLWHLNFSVIYPYRF